MRSAVSQQPSLYDSPPTCVHALQATVARVKGAASHGQQPRKSKQIRGTAAGPLPPPSFQSGHRDLHHIDLSSHEVRDRAEHDVMNAKAIAGCKLGMHDLCRRWRWLSAGAFFPQISAQRSAARRWRGGHALWGTIAHMHTTCGSCAPLLPWIWTSYPLTTRLMYVQHSKTQVGDLYSKHSWYLHPSPSI